ncbi:MAG: hypothetical protein EOM52_05605 [Clostridia bacterium]|nr:hypothetical protein [Clostridia bacterium]
MTTREILLRYVPLIQFMGAICGSDYEVILHDVSTPDQSVIAIENGYLSGRKVGDPMTELARDIIRRGDYLGRDFIANYEGRTKDGRQFVSSTYFIKEGDEPIGLICVNHDVADFTAINTHLQKLMRAFSHPQVTQKASYTETLDDSIASLSTSIIHASVSQSVVPARRMTPSEKLELVRAWDHQGVFATKGSVAQAAAR